jgi:glycosyltransferase involved in cell wall biosynthesis
VKALLWHGYLLTGSGSNVYTGNVARAWRTAGHDVLVLCQDRSAAGLDFVDGVIEMGPDGSMVAERPTSAPAARGRCIVAQPDIGGLLPVYVWDAYEGFESKLFIDLTEEELDRYVEANVAALVSATRQHQPDAILVGHEVMGPEIARRAGAITGAPYAVQLHGSGLEYAVKKQERYREHAARGIGGAATVIGGSNYMIDAARRVTGEWPGSSTVVNPGCDIELFGTVDREAPHDVPRIAFVGKLIAAKGVQDLLAAMSMTRARDASLTVVGYGGFEEGLHAIHAALQRGDLGAARRAIADNDDGNLEGFKRFLDEVQPADLERYASLDIGFPGRLEHGPLARFLPTLDALIVPSVVPEAFGMVAAEAAACGVLPIVPSHSGIGEAGAAIEEAIGRPGLLTFDASDPIPSLAETIDRVLDVPFEQRIQMGRRAAELARERWSWHVVGERLLQAATSR